MDLHRGDGMYRCKNTGKNSNVRIGTMFEGSKVSDPKNFRQTPTKIDVEFDRKEQKNNTKKKGKK